MHTIVMYRFFWPSSQIFHSNEFSLHSNSTILVLWRESAVQINFSSFWFGLVIIQNFLFIIQNHENSTNFGSFSFKLARQGFMTSWYVNSWIQIHSRTFNLAIWTVILTKCIQIDVFCFTLLHLLIIYLHLHLNQHCH